MPPPDRDVIQGPSFPSRIQRDGHRRSGAQGPEQEVVGTRAGIGTAVGHGLVRQEVVAAGTDLLRKPGCAATYLYHTGIERLVHGTAPCWGIVEHNPRLAPFA